MSTDSSCTRLEEAIIRNACEALEELSRFEQEGPSSDEDWFEALNHAAEANALIKLAMERDSGIMKETTTHLRKLEPLVAKALVKLRKDARMAQCSIDRFSVNTAPGLRVC